MGSSTLHVAELVASVQHAGCMSPEKCKRILTCGKSPRELTCCIKKYDQHTSKLDQCHEFGRPFESLDVMATCDWEWVHPLFAEKLQDLTLRNVFSLTTPGHLI